MGSEMCIRDRFITIASDEELPSSSYLYVVPIQNKEGTVHSIAIYEIKKNTLTKVLDAYSPASTNLNYIIDESYQLVTKTKSEELNTFLSTPYSVEKLMTKENVKIKQKRYLIQSLKNPYLNLSLLSLVDPTTALLTICLLYTSDAADEEDSVDLGGRRNIKKKKRIVTCRSANIV